MFFAFLGTGRCNPTDLRNAGIGRVLIIVTALGLVTFIVKKMLLGNKGPTSKIGGWLLILVIAFIAAAAIFFIDIGVACSGY